MLANFGFKESASGQNSKGRLTGSGEGYKAVTPFHSLPVVCMVQALSHVTNEIEKSSSTSTASFNTIIDVNCIT